MKVKVGVIQDNPVFFNKEESFEKLESLAIQYGHQGCQLILFPESFIPGYPRGLSFGTVVGSRSKAGKELYQDYVENSVDLSSVDCDRLEKIAKNAGSFLVIGITERSQGTGTLYCSMAYFSPHSGLLGVHRKIKPTGQERVIWGEAGGESLVSFQTPIGRLGGLICWENYMPLARMSMYNKGVEIYLAPTADSRTNWTYTMQHIALEGRCFVLGSNQYFTKSMYPPQYSDLVEGKGDSLCRGGSLIVSPGGHIIEGPLYDQPGCLTAELDLGQILQSKLDFDPVGHYARPDIFQLDISGQPPIRKVR